MSRGRILFVTGTDTGVGKTVLSILLVRHLQDQGVSVQAVKPICSGGRSDAIALWMAQGQRRPLDEVNPWHFRRPLTPLLAARAEGKVVTLPEVAEFLTDAARECEMLISEGAGGLLSPLGPGFSNRELIARTRATPLLVTLNRLGAVNQVLMALAALAKPTARRTPIVLMGTRRDLVSRTNAQLLREFLGVQRVHTLPWKAEELWNRRSRTAVSSNLAAAPRLPRSIGRKLAAILAAV